MIIDAQEVKLALFEIARLDGYDIKNAEFKFRISVYARNMTWHLRVEMSTSASPDKIYSVETPLRAYADVGEVDFVLSRISRILWGYCKPSFFEIYAVKEASFE